MKHPDRLQRLGADHKTQSRHRRIHPRRNSPLHAADGADGRLCHHGRHRAKQSRSSRAANPEAGDEYRQYVASVPEPEIVIVQHLDQPRTYGALGGELNANVHRALGCSPKLSPDEALVNRYVDDLQGGLFVGVWPSSLRGKWPSDCFGNPSGVRHLGNGLIDDARMESVVPPLLGRFKGRDSRFLWSSPSEADSAPREWKRLWHDDGCGYNGG
jgi:hypothetical protein